jgi:hypothetical protein
MVKAFWRSGATEMGNPLNFEINRLELHISSPRDSGEALRVSDLQSRTVV